MVGGPMREVEQKPSLSLHHSAQRVAAARIGV
jgi:hypothetical protein